MNEIENRLRNLAERMKNLKPEDLEGKENLVDELDNKTKELEDIYKRGE